MALRGSEYRVVRQHPRRVGPLGPVTDKAGNVIAKPGQKCGKVPQKFLRSMLDNGFIERIDSE